MIFNLFQCFDKINSIAIDTFYILSVKSKLKSIKRTLIYHINYLSEKVLVHFLFQFYYLSDFKCFNFFLYASLNDTLYTCDNISVLPLWTYLPGESLWKKRVHILFSTSCTICFFFFKIRWNYICTYFSLYHNGDNLCSSAFFNFCICHFH